MPTTPVGRVATVYPVLITKGLPVARVLTTPAPLAFVAIVAVLAVVLQSTLNHSPSDVEV